MAKLAWAYPRLTVEIHINDAFVDIVAQGFDAGIRLGEAVQQDMVTVRLTPAFKEILLPICRATIVSASGCLVRAGWDLSDQGKDVSVRTTGTAVVTDPTCARDLALPGIGIAYGFEPLVSSDIREGRLKWVLPDSAVEEDGLFLYYPRRARHGAKTARLHRYRPEGIRAVALAGCRRAVASHT